MALLQIKLTPISPRLPSLVMLLCNRPARGLLPKFNRLLTLHDNDEHNHMALVNRQSHAYVEVDTPKNIPFLPVGQTVAVQSKDAVIWTFGSGVGHGSDDHISRSYKIRVTKKGCTMKRTKRHMKSILITAQDYL